MTTPSNFSNADFLSIKEDLKTFLAQTTEFRDFDFEGSAASMLINMLAYTSNYMAIHANMALTEVFMDSAQRRSSVVSRAKEIGYFPRQISAARGQAGVTVEFTPSTSTVSTMTIKEGSVFSSKRQGDTSYEFITVKDTNLALVSGNKYYGTVDVYEGKILSRKFTYPANTNVPKFTLPDKDIETDYFKVRVKEPGDSVFAPYIRETNSVNTLSDSKVFFLQEGPNEAIEMYFGDGLIGYKPAIGSEIIVEYLVTKGQEANGVNSFLLESSPITSLSAGGTETVPLSQVLTETLEKSAYGAPKQDIESVRFTAPKAWAAQNRAVTVDDYQALLLREFGFIDTITVWGGETNDPPQYGKVLISVKPRDGTRLSPAVKQSMKENVLDRYSIVGIIPEIVDPDYTFVDVTTLVSYDKEKTFDIEPKIVGEISNAVSGYFSDVVTKFNSTFRFSSLVAAIDDSNPAILGNNTSYTLIKGFQPIPNQLKKYTIKFFNPITPGSFYSEPVVSSTGAVLTLIGRENGRIDALLNGNVSSTGIGTINHTKGEIEINYRFDVPVNTTVNCVVKCANQDILAKQNNLITLRNTRVSLVRYYKNPKA